MQLLDSDRKWYNRLFKDARIGNFSYTEFAKLSEKYPHLMNAMDLTGCTLLMYACKHSDSIAGDLIDLGADPSFGDSKKNTPLHYACNSHLNIKVVQKLLGANVNSVNHYNETPLIVAIKRSGNIELVKCLVENGAKNYIYEGKTTLDHATECGDEVVIEYLSQLNDSWLTFQFRDAKDN